MINITKAGLEALAEYTGNNNRKEVRIIVAGYG